MSRQVRRLLLLSVVLVVAIGCWSGMGSGTGSAVHELTIFHLNDLHARLLPDEKGRGGFAHLATLLRREKSAAAAHLTLHAGDLVQGSPVSTLFEGLPIMEVASRLGIDVHCLGNHEFDYGWQKIPEYVKLSEFDTVSANVVDAAGKTLVEPYVVRRAGGLRVAVVGALTDRLLELTVSDRLGPWQARSLVDTLRPVVAEARERADLVVVLAHLKTGESERILEGLRDVDVVVRGHGHEGWPEPVEIDGRIAVDAPGYGRALGRLRLAYDVDARRIRSYDWRTLPVESARLPADPLVQELVQHWEAKTAEIVDLPIGRSSRFQSREEVRDLMERAMLEQAQADVAHMNFGGVRDVLPEGPLLARHIWNAMPFDNGVVTATLSGELLMGLRNASGEPVVRGTVLDPQRSYRFVTTDFIVQGWEDQGLELPFEDEGVLLRDLLLAWVKAREVVP